MNTVRFPSVEERARRHAALAEPTRLQMVDLLTLGDLSPTELREAVGLPSNLLAHHLNALEREGIITRGRSEGDRRRTYVRLAPGALSDLAPAATASADRVVFVCSANSARSQLAQALWNAASAVPAASAGTHPADSVAAGALATAARHGLDLSNATPRLVDEVVTDDAFIITVCDRAHEEYSRSMVHWSIPDPVQGGTDAAFEAAFDDLRRRVDNLVPRLTAA